MAPTEINLLMSCNQEMTTGSNAIEANLSMAICSCYANKVVSAYTKAEIAVMESDIAANYGKVAPLMKQCITAEMQSAK